MRNLALPAAGKGQEAYKKMETLARKRGAVYKIGKKVLIKRSTFEKYLRENIRREKEEWER